MRKKTKYRKILDWYYDHYRFAEILIFVAYALVTGLAGTIFAFGFSAFMTGHGEGSYSFVTGGVSGISQDIVFILQLCGVKADPSMLQSIFYFCINIPIILFAYFKIGKRFGILSLINVGLSTLFINLFGNAQFIKDIANSELISSSPLSRVLFAGICSGFGSALAFVANSSSGGIDVVSYYIGERKSSAVGKYNILINTIILVTYFIIMISGSATKWTDSFVIILYSILYLVVVGLVIDLINVKNKKVQIQIVTSNEQLPDLLISSFPHSATFSKGKGVYSKVEKTIVWMVVSSKEDKKVVRLAKAIDKDAFITVSPLNQVYGNFFIKRVQ